MKNLLFYALTAGVISVASAQDGEFHLDNEYKIKADATIDLVSSDANVFITGSKRTSARVKIDRKVITKGLYSGEEDFKVEVDVVDGDLRIRERASSYNSGIITYQREEYKIEIEAPEGVSLVIRGDDGDYFIKNVNGEISMNIDDADVELTECKGNAFTFRVDDGDVRMNGGEGMLEIDGDDADIEIHNGAFTSISADMDDGDLILETSLTDDGSYSIRTEDGSINLKVLGGGGEFEIDHDDGNVVLQGAFKTLIESDDHTRVLLARGKAKVRLRGDDANVKLIAGN